MQNGCGTLAKMLRRGLKELTPRNLQLAEGLLQGQRAALSRSITLIESSLAAHREQADLLLDYVLSRSESRKSFRVGIAGPPGAGKSTLIEALGTKLVSEERKVAVLAIDPSSSLSGGSILGDKTRMSELGVLENAFVRPSPSKCTLGGVAEHTHEVSLLCEAAGYDIVLIETVGLGQSEVAVDHVCDMVWLVLPPGGGDELQGVKKGIMEICDLAIVNKADGAFIDAARQASSDLMNALHILRPRRKSWFPKVKRCSALHKEKIDGVWKLAEEFRECMESSGELADSRLKQRNQWMWDGVQSRLSHMMKECPDVAQASKIAGENLVSGKQTPRSAAASVLDSFLDWVVRTRK